MGKSFFPLGSPFVITWIGWEIPFLGITVCHHSAATNGCSEGQIFLSHPLTNIWLFFLPTIKNLILCFEKKLPKAHEFAERQHDMMT